MDRGTLATWTAAWQLHTPVGDSRSAGSPQGTNQVCRKEHSRIASRIQKVLEDANLKLASVVR